jgi:hypothetical protein
MQAAGKQPDGLQAGSRTADAALTTGSKPLRQCGASHITTLRRYGGNLGKMHRVVQVLWL